MDILEIREATPEQVDKAIALNNYPMVLGNGQRGYMFDKNGNWYGQSKRDYLVQCATLFVDPETGKDLEFPNGFTISIKLPSQVIYLP